MTDPMISDLVKPQMRRVLCVALFGAMTMSLGACATGGDSPFGSSVFVDPPNTIFTIVSSLPRPAKPPMTVWSSLKG
jgi:hypothetical protein